MGIAEAEDAEAGDHGHRRIAAPAAPVHPRHGAEDVLLVDAQLPLDLQLVGEDVEQDLGVRLGVEVAQVVDVDVALQVLRVGQVAVVGQRDAVGGVDVEGLGLGGAGGSGRRVAGVTEPHGAPQLDHVAGAKDVLDQAVVLAQVQPIPLAGDDARRILAPVLEHQQGVVE